MNGARHQAKGQAITELAVFGAILIFILGTIIRTAVSNGYQQDVSFKAMRMAMLASWNDSRANPGSGPQVTAHNSATVLFVEDRLAPDYGKYGSMDRNPFMVSGSGTFSYNLLYPINNDDPADIKNSLPIMDVYINGQHFPFTLASYVANRRICPPGQCAEFPACGDGTPMTPAQAQAQCLKGCGGETDLSCAQQCQLAAVSQCKLNQCMRNRREWGGLGTGLISTGMENSQSNLAAVTEKMFDTNSPAVAPITATTASVRLTQQSDNACTIFTDLLNAGVLANPTSSTYCSGNTQATVDLQWSSGWPQFERAYERDFQLTARQAVPYLVAIEGLISPAGNGRFKLFYTLVANPGGTPDASNNSSNMSFSTTAPYCSAHGSTACRNMELSSDVPLLDYWGKPTTDGSGSSINSNGVMQYDLYRIADYSQTAENDAAGKFTDGVLYQFPPCAAGSPCMRNFIAWQWAATAGTSAAEIGLSSSNHVYPTYDIDGRLKEVTIYNLTTDSSHPGWPVVDYVDEQGGDIDGTWDVNSCSPQPGLQSQQQVFTFTKNSANATNNGKGTYLLIQDGKLYNPETNPDGSHTFVRSANKRDTIDLIQRVIQLTNNTGRFCSKGGGTPQLCNAACVTNLNSCTAACATGTNKAACLTGCANAKGDCDSACANPNPVEVCVNQTGCPDGPYCNCFSTQDNIKSTCYDTVQNKIFVRSRIENRRGFMWATNTSGRYQVGR
ncbi:MAG: hypothetical protein KGK03_01390 [Candidatus Omnitrophica bacterium]|nr:hypothetical protein [Candidatus Omnitrophota bacterium]